MTGKPIVQSSDETLLNSGGSSSACFFWNVQVSVMFLALLVTQCESFADEASLASSNEASQWISILDEALSQKGSLVSVHAAELLLQLGQDDVVRKRFIVDDNAELTAFQVVGLRVIARCAESAEMRESAVSRIRQTLLDPESKFHPHAMESLAKLQAPILPEEAELVNEIAFSSTDSAAPFALWRLAQTDSSKAAFRQLERLLESKDEVTSFRAAYALWHLRPLPESVREALEKAAQGKSPSPMFALMVRLAGELPGAWELARNADRPAARYFMALELGDSSDADVCEQLEVLLRDENLDVRQAAAAGLLKQNRTFATGEILGR